MSEEHLPATVRLFGMMQYLNAARVQGVPPEQPSPRDVVQKNDALEAVFHLGIAIDQAHEAGHLPFDRAAWMGSLLMVIHDYIRPLPRDMDEDQEKDLATDDLTEMVEALRQSRGTLT